MNTHANQDSLGKAVSLLRCFVDGQEEWGVRELASALRQPTSSVHRLLRILRREGWLEFDDISQKYRTGLELVRIGSVVAQRYPLRRIASRAMKSLALLASESVWLSVYEPNRKQVVYVTEQRSAHALRHDAPIGQSANLADDLTGQLVLAHMPESEARRILGDEAYRNIRERLLQIRLDGFVLRDRTEEDPVVLIAAPIIDSGKTCVGALTLAIPVHRYSPEKQAELAAAVRAASDRVSHHLGAQLLGGASSGSWYDGIETIAELMQDHVTGLTATPTLGGGTRNLLELVEGRGAYCMTTWSSLKSASEGSAPFKKKHGSLRAVMNLSTLKMHVVCQKGVQIETFSDIARYRVSPGLVGFSTYHLFYETLRLAGLNEASFKERQGSIVHFDYPEAARQFEKGNIDVIFWMTATPNSLLTRLSMQGANVTGLDRGLIDAVLDGNDAYERAEIDAGTYHGQSRAIQTIAVRTTLATLADRPEVEVNDVVRTLFQRRDDLSRISPAYSFDARFAAKEGPVPFHAGAHRYWNEVLSVDPR